VVRPAVLLPDIGVVLTYLVILWLPGTLVLLAFRVRGWTLVGCAPLITYGVVGLIGPILSALGFAWTAMTYGVAVAVLAVVVAVVRVVGARRALLSPAHAPRPGWGWPAHVAVGVVTAAAAAVGSLTILTGIGTLSAVPQDWDAVFHANGIRWIADTGDGGLYGMARVNWYENGVAVFYPNAYHLVGSVVYQLTGATIPTVLNAHTVLLPGILALSMVTLIHTLRGRAVHAGFTALIVVSISAFYDLLWRGPLLPFATGIALTPVIVALLLRLDDAPRWRATLAPALLLALGVAGLGCIHPAVVIGAVLFTAPALVQRWWQRPQLMRRGLPALLLSGAVAAILCSLQIAGAASSGSNLSSIDWPADVSQTEAIGQLLTFSHAAEFPQWWLLAALMVGLLSYRKLRDLRWIGAVAVTFGSLFVVAASYDDAWANAITSFWWNDRWRFAALTAVPLCVIAGHGLAEVQRLVRTGLERVGTRIWAAPGRGWATAGGATTAAVVLFVFVILSNELYIARNAARMALNVGDGPALSEQEVVGITTAAGIVPRGSRVLNDRGDGSVWLYALGGLQPVAGHYDAARIGPDATLLAERFRDYGIDPAVREAARRLGIQYVFIGTGFLRSWSERQPGLVDLDGAPWLTPLYRNSDVVLYEVHELPEPQTTPTPTG
jgi:hypothetical protein